MKTRKLKGPVAHPHVPKGIEDIHRATVETLEITIRAARRCAYDLKHCAESLAMRRPNSASDAEMAKLFMTRADHFVKLFQNGNSMKDYRIKLHTDLDDANDTIEKLRAILVEHKIDDPTLF